MELILAKSLPNSHRVPQSDDPQATGFKELFFLLVSDSCLSPYPQSVQSAPKALIGREAIDGNFTVLALRPPSPQDLGEGADVPMNPGAEL